MKSNSRTLVPTLTMMVLTAACVPPSPTPAAPVVPRYEPKFTYTPPSTAAPGSAGVVLGLIQAPTTDASIATFRGRLNADLEKLMVARGYRLQGPFGTYDELTFTDKKTIEMIVVPTISLGWNIASVQQEKARYSDLSSAERQHIETGRMLLGGLIPEIDGDAVHLSGEAIITGRFDIQLVEPMSHEKLWVKTIQVEGQKVSFTSSTAYALRRGEDPKTRLAGDLELSNAVSKALDDQYTHICSEIWRYMDPAELRTLKGQAKELKGRKVF